MIHEVKEVKTFQKEGNSIIHFKTTKERELAKEIEKENRELANSYLEFKEVLESRNSIIGFKGKRARLCIHRKIAHYQTITGLQVRKQQHTIALHGQ